MKFRFSLFPFFRPPLDYLIGYSLKISLQHVIQLTTPNKGIASVKTTFFSLQ